jgi:hypothetical protein
MPHVPQTISPESLSVMGMLPHELQGSSSMEVLYANLLYADFEV